MSDRRPALHDPFVRRHPPDRAHPPAMRPPSEAASRVRIQCGDSASLGAAFLRAEDDLWVDDCIVDTQSLVLTISRHGTRRDAAEWQRRVKAIQGL